jgi:hypothetical protein
MSGQSSSERDGADLGGRIERPILSSPSQFTACTPPRIRAFEHPVQAVEESPSDLSGRVLSHLESQFADLFR